MRICRLLRDLTVVILVLVAAAASSCSSSTPTPAMKSMINGVICDPDRATLIAEQTNEAQVDNFTDLQRTDLYRTVGGHYFIELEDGGDLKVKLVSRTDAMKVYSALPDRRLGFDQAFMD